MRIVVKPTNIHIFEERPPDVGGWHCVTDEDGDIIAYCPDVATAEAVAEAETIRRYLVDHCKQVTCVGRAHYRGRLHHDPTCPAYNLGLTKE